MTTFLALPASGLARVRLGFLVCGLLLVFDALVAIGVNPRQQPLDLVVGAGVIWLSWYWVRWYERASFSPVWLVPEGLALFAVGVATGPVRALGLLCVGLCLRGLSGDGRQWWLGVVTYVGAYAGALVLSPRQAPDWLLSPQALSPLCAVILAAGLAHLLATTMAAVERVMSRSQRLLHAGTEMATAVSWEQLYARALEAALALLEQRQVQLSLALGPEGQQAVVATARTQKAGSRHSTGVAARVTVLPDWAGPASTLTVTSDRALSTPDREALASLGSQVGLALARLALVEELARSQGESRFRSLVQHSSDVITVIGVDGTIRYQALSITAVLGYRPAELIGKKLMELIHPDDVRHASGVFAEMLQPRWVSPPVEWRFRHSDGSWRHVETVATNLLDDPTVRGIVLNTRDISERKALEARLLQQAFHDPLTQLANRALLRDRLEQALKNSQRTKQALAVLFLDLDNFKTINDSLGHAAGDALLIAVTQRLRASLRAADTAARLGGDEFAILMEGMTFGTEATYLAERITGALQSPFSLAGKEVFVGTSIGIALSATGKESADDVLRNADVAMYMAKNRGKGCYAVFEPSMHEAALVQLELQADLQHALQRHEFVVHYQPIVLLETGRIVGVEALLRWQHPRRGLRSPAEFMVALEETGLILPVGRWLLRQSCRQLQAWQVRYPAHPPLSLSVNLSARQFLQPALTNDVAQALHESGVAPNSLILEITESNLMQDTESTIGKLRELKDLGVQLAIDDFGTGYSSLSYLQHFPLDILKIDKSFVAEIGKGSEAAALANTIITLGAALNLRMVAEGIEAPEQWQQLPGPGCHLGQGFYFARPCTPEEMTMLLERASASDTWWTQPSPAMSGVASAKLQLLRGEPEAVAAGPHPAVPA